MANGPQDANVALSSIGSFFTGHTASSPRIVNVQPTELDVLAILLAAAAMALALVGTVFPAFPGVILAWAASLVFGLVVGFDAVGVVIMLVITAVTGTAYVAMVKLPKEASEARGASKSALRWGALGAIVGFFVIPVVGFVVGGVAGVFGAEYARTKDTEPAWEATKGVLIGFGKSSLVQIAAALVIIVLWLVWVVVRFEI